MMNVDVNTRVIANYGAMHPQEEGTVTYVHDDGLCNVMFDDGIFRMGIYVRQPGERSANGSPIGVFVNEYAN